MESTFFGQFLIAEGIVTAPQLTAAVEYQQKFNGRLGEYAVALGCIDEEDARRINELQTSKNLRFGEAAVALGLFDERQLEKLVKAQQEEHVLLGQALTDLGYVDEPTLADALQRFIDEQGDEPGYEVPDAHPLAREARVIYPRSGQLLTQVWGLANKPRGVHAKERILLLSDCNVSVPLAGDCKGHLVVGAARHVLQAVGATRGLGDSTGDALVGLLGELVAQLAEGLRQALSEQGVTLQLGPVQPCGFRVALEERQRALLVPYLTHHGQVLVCLVGWLPEPEGSDDAGDGEPAAGGDTA